MSGGRGGRRKGGASGPHRMRKGMARIGRHRIVPEAVRLWGKMCGAYDRHIGRGVERLATVQWFY
jgi:hypothetical protein